MRISNDDADLDGLDRKRKKKRRNHRWTFFRPRNLLRRTFWSSRLPFLGFASSYGLDCLVGDLIAGVTTALTVIPQGIGYAPLAGLPLQVRLYRQYRCGWPLDRQS